MQVGEFAVTVTKISVDATTPGRMAGIIGVGYGEAFQDAELCFDQIEPGGLRRRPDGLDPQSPQPSKETEMIVDVAQIVQNHKKPLARVATAQAAKGLADVRDGLATAEQATEAVCVYVVKSQELLGSFQTAISRWYATAVSGEPKPYPRWASDPEVPTRRSTLPRYAAGSVDRASGCVFFTVEGRVVGGLPGSDPLGCKSFPAQ